MQSIFHNVDEFEVLGILENSYAMQVLVFLMNNPGKLRSELYAEVSGSKKTLQNRVDELIAGGLIDEVNSPTHRRGRMLYLTPIGMNAAKSILGLKGSLKGEEVEPMDYGASTEEGNKVR